MIDGYSYKATPHAFDPEGFTSCATEIHIAAADGNEYKNSFNHDDMAGKFAILHMPGAAAALFQRRPDKISAEGTDRLRVEWTIACPLTGPHTIAIHMPISKRADPVDRLRVECEKRDMERKNEIAALRDEIAALRAARELERKRDITTARILDYFDEDIYEAYIEFGGAEPSFMSDPTQWLNLELDAGFSITTPSDDAEKRWDTYAILHRMAGNMSIFAYMAAKIGTGTAESLGRAEKFLCRILDYVEPFYIHPLCRWLEKTKTFNGAAVAKILRRHLADAP